MTAIWTTVVVLALITALIKAAGPAVLGDRELPPRFVGVIVLMGPAVLAALIATHTFAEGRHLRVDAATAGVAVAAIAAWRGASAITSVAMAVGVTVVLRLMGG